MQFRYLFVTTADGLLAIDVTAPDLPQLVADNLVPLKNANGLFVSRTYAYVAAGADGLVIVDVQQPTRMRKIDQFSSDGQIVDAHDVIVASTNASLFAYIADGIGGLKVVQLTAPDTQPKFYGFSPLPKPTLIAHYPTRTPALSLSKGLERDRGVDETGGQVAVFGRKGARPLNVSEMQRLYLRKGRPWTVTNDPDGAREKIFAIHLRRRERDPAKFDLKRLAAASDGFSGAEIEQAVVAALYAAHANSLWSQGSMPSSEK